MSPNSPDETSSNEGEVSSFLVGIIQHHTEVPAYFQPKKVTLKNSSPPVSCGLLSWDFSIGLKFTPALNPKVSEHISK